MGPIFSHFVPKSTGALHQLNLGDQRIFEALTAHAMVAAED